MNTQTAAVATIEAVEERKDDRVPFAGSLAYRCSQEDAGIATWCSVGREGACIRLGHYLRPGRHIILVTDAVKVRGGSAELSARVVWCRPTADGRTFVAGLRMFVEDPEAHYALTAIIGKANAGASKCLAN